MRNRVRQTTEPELTIVIPTRNRARTLRSTLESIVTQAEPGIRVHVMDNCSEDETTEVVTEFAAEGVRLFVADEVLSMSDNFSRGVDTVESEWVTILGSDDGFIDGALGHLLPMLRRCETYAIRAARYEYLWPGATGSGVGELMIHVHPSALLRRPRLVRRRAETDLQAVLDGREGYARLPVLYNGGFVRTAAVRSLPRVGGSLFPANVPDVYSGIALSMRFGDWDEWLEPVVMNGASTTSNGRATFGTHDEERDRKLRDAFLSEQRSPFPHVLPNEHPPRSLQYFIYVSYLAALDAGLTSSATTTLGRQVELIGLHADGRPDVTRWVNRMRGSTDRSHNSTGSSPPRTRDGFTSTWRCKMSDSCGRLALSILEPLRALALSDAPATPLQDVASAARVAKKLRWVPRRLAVRVSLLRQFGSR